MKTKNEIIMERFLFFISVFILLSINVYGQNTFSGKIVYMWNPCQTEPCLPGGVFGLETTSKNYILTINSNWIWTNNKLIVEDIEYSIDDEVEMTGITTVKQDINSNEYTELEIQTIKKVDNNTIVNDNSSWSVLSYVYGADSVGNTAIVGASTDYYFFDGDSIVGDKIYKKLYQYSNEQHTNRILSGFVREENQKTYFVDNKFVPNFSLENILYDFSLEEGNIFEKIKQSADYYGNIYRDTMYFFVQSCDTVIINSEPKKRMILKFSESDLMVDTVIENVGSLHGLLYPLCYICSGGFHELLCYSQNDELFYQNPKYSKCYWSLEDFTSLKKLAVNVCHIFPNPADDIINISCLNNAISRIEIVDIAGKKVYSHTYKEDTIDVSSFSKGLYLLKMYDTKGQVSLLKFIKE